MTSKFTETQTVSIKIPSFYSIIRPIAILCKVLGTFSLKNSLSSDGRYLQYQLVSLDTLWSPFLHITTSTLLWKYLTLPWFIATYWLELHRSISSVIFCIYYDKFLSRLIRNLEEFDNFFYQKCRRTPTRTLFGNGYIWIVISLILFAVSITYSSTISGAYPERSPVRSAVECILFLNSWFACQTIIMFYLLICINVSSRFTDVSFLLRSIIDRITDKPRGRVEIRDEDFVNGLEKIRSFHSHLSEVVVELNKCYGMKLANHLAMCFIQMVVDVYQYIYNLGTTTNTAVVFLSYQTMSILIAGAITENLTESVSTPSM